LANGLLAASLFFTPALDVLHAKSFSAGGAANAQGFVSSKKTSASPSTDANKDPESILRLSLPINDKNPIREVQVCTCQNNVCMPQPHYGVLIVDGQGDTSLFCPGERVCQIQRLS
jgi:hypothetical protein